MIEYVPGKIEPVCLPDNTTIPEDYSAPCWGAGWGHTNYMGRISPVLNEVDLPIIPDTTCGTSLVGGFFNSTIQRCAGHMEGMVYFLKF